MEPDEIKARVAEAARSFDAELHTAAYAETHSDAAQLARLLSLLSPVYGQVVLDLGTGNGYVAMALARAHLACRVIGVDVADQALVRALGRARARGLSNADFVSYDGVSLPFADDCFDTAVCRYAFHHVPRPDMTLDELSRVIRVGGRLVLADAIRDDADDVDFVNRFQEMKRDGHVRMHREAELIDLICGHGFALIERFESSISFSRKRSPDYDDLLSATPDGVRRVYSIMIGEQEISLTFRILNAVFANDRKSA
jgi:ubiquinone/menaquinone biosynthesis C-methylase UbiE